MASKNKCFKVSSCWCCC